MEAHLWPIRLNVPFRNIRFAYNTLALGFHRLYDRLARGTILSPVRRGVTSVLSSRDRSVGGFDGPFVALFFAAVHSPRRDDVYHRERGKILLRRWHRRAGLRPIPDHRCRTKGSPQP